MDYKETLANTASSSNSGNNQILDSDDDGTNWESLAAESSQSTSGTKRKRNWPSKGRYGAAAKRKKSNSPMKRKTARKPAGAKKTPAKAKKTLGKKFTILLVVFHLTNIFIFTGFLTPKF